MPVGAPTNVATLARDYRGRGGLVRAMAHRYPLIAVTLLGALLGGASTSAASAASGAQPIAMLSRPVPIADGGGWLLWSVPVPGGWGLEGDHDGTLTRIRAAPRPWPFDVQAGTADGFAVAVFSRCTRTPRMSAVDEVEHEGMPADGGSLLLARTGSGCRIHELRLPDGPEATLAIPRPPHSSDTTPAIWHGEVAFSRITPAHGKVAQVRLWSPRKPGRLLTLRHGAAPACAPLRRECEPPEGEVEGLAFDGKIVSFLWTIFGGAAGPIGNQEVRLDRLGGVAQGVFTREAGEVCFGGTDGGLELLNAGVPAAVGETAIFSELQQFNCFGRFSSRLARYRPGAARPELEVISGNLLAVTGTGSQLFALLAPDDSVSGLLGPSCTDAMPCALERLAVPVVAGA